MVFVEELQKIAKDDFSAKYTPISFARFLNNCIDSDIVIDEFKSIIYDLNYWLIQGTNSSQSFYLIKDSLLFLRELSSLFASFKYSDMSGAIVLKNGKKMHVAEADVCSFYSACMALGGLELLVAEIYDNIVDGLYNYSEDRTPKKALLFLLELGIFFKSVEK